MPFDVQGALAEGHQLPEIADYLGQQKNFDVAGARQAGWSDQAIVDHLNPDTGFGAGFRYGLAQPIQGAADTADIAGATGVGDTLRGAAKSVAPTNYSPAAPEIGKNLAAGNYREAASYVPRAVTEGLGTGLGYIGAAAGGAAAGGEVAGPAGAIVGGIAAPVAAGIATSYGPNVKARAANAGEKTPSTSSYLGAIPGTAGEVALNTIGAGAGPIGEAATGALPAILKPVARAALDATGTGAADLAAQQAQGGPIDPYQAAGAAVQGAGARGVTEATNVAKAGGAALGDRIARSGLPDITNPADAASRDRILTEFQQARQDAKSFGEDIPDTAILNNIKQTKAALVRGLATQLRDDGYIEPEEFNTLVRPAMEQAQRHNNTLTDGPGTPFGDLHALNVPPERLQPLINGLRDLNTVSDQTLIKNTRGPFSTVLNGLGQAAGIGAAAIPAFSGHFEPLIAAAMGHSLLGKVGGGAGTVLDRMFGTNKAPITLQAAQVQRVLKQAGIAAGDSSNQQMIDALTAGRDDRTALATQLGMMGAKASQYMPSPDLSVKMAPEQVLALPTIQQAHLADMASVSLRELQAGAQQGLTPAEIAKGRDLTEKAANTVSGQAYRQGQWPNPQVDEANFVNTDGAAGKPNTGFTTPGVIKGNTIVGKPASGGSTTQQTDKAVAQAMQEANVALQLNGQEMRSSHASQMAIKAAGNQNLRSSLNGGSGDEASAGSANGADPVAQAKASVAATTPAGGGSFASGWKAYVHRGLKDHGIDANVSDIHDAVDTLAQQGHLNDVFPDGIGPQGAAQALKQHKGNLTGPLGREVMNRVASQVASAKGKAGHLDQEAAGPAPQLPGGAASGTTTGPIRDPARWEAARQDAHAVAGRIAGGLSQLAQTPGMEGLHTTAALVNSLPHASMKSTVSKQQAWAAHLQTLTPPQRMMAQRAMAAAPGLLVGK